MRFKYLIRAGGVAVASYVGLAQAQFIDVASPSSSWLPILVGERFDPVGDEQANPDGIDLVGDAQHPSLYGQYDDNSTEDESDDEIGFRFRIGANSDDNVYLIGLDANQDGQIDLFVSADGRNNERAIALWGSGSCNKPVCNIGPSTTTLSSDWIYNESFTDQNYNFSKVTVIEKDIVVKDSDIGDRDGEDHFVSFKLKFARFKEKLTQESGLTISKSTPIRYVAFSLTQPNSINGDFDGIHDKNDDGYNTKTFEELGLFTPPLTADPSSANNSISGFVFNDTDGDGVFDEGGAALDEGESGLANVAITLGGAVTQTTTTDSAGFYAFQFLAPGTYSVTETDPADAVVDSGTSNSIDNIVLARDTSYTVNFADVFGVSNQAPYFDPNTNTDLTATQGDEFSYTIQTLDLENDARSITAIDLPGWLRLDDNGNGTALLSGTPTDANAAPYPFTLVVTENDAPTQKSEQAFTITVAQVENEKPYFDPNTNTDLTTTQGDEFSYTIQTLDLENDARSITAIDIPSWLKLDDNGNGTALLSGTPTEANAEPYPFILVVTEIDAPTQKSEKTFGITVEQVENEKPYFDPNTNTDLTATQGDEFSYTIQTLDLENDVRSITAIDLPSWLRLDDNGNGTALLSGTPKEANAEPYPFILVVTEIDAPTQKSEQTFTINVNEANLEPTITAPPTVAIDASALFTKVALGTATAVDHYGNPLPVSLINGDPFFQPGANIALWQACDQDDRCATAEQSVLVRPLISLAKDQVLLEGNEAKIEVVMNGTHFHYPVVVPYTVSGTASGDDHSLASGEVIIESGSSAVIQFEVYDDDVNDEGEIIEVTLGDTINRGNKYVHNVTIAESNLPPEISLTASQSGEQRLVAAKNADDMMISAHLTDPNAGDVHDIEWLPDGSLEPHLSHEALEASFNPELLPVGLYRLSVRATDQAGESDIATIYIEVTDALNTLSLDLDSDGDNIPDAVEGHADIDLDGIPDYLDQVTDECNVLPETGNYFKGYIIEGDPAVCLRVGKFSTLGVTGGGQLVDEDIVASEEDELIPDPDAENIGGIFDFIAYKLPESGQSFQVVLPQRKAIPASAVYRKLVRNDLTDEYQWETLIEGDGNKIHSSEGEPGYCPPPGGNAWSEGLTEGHWCVQLTLVDGGHYDNDGRANGSVVDPGGVAVMTSFNTPPIAEDDVVRLREGKTHDIDVLANDTDTDGDSLSITSASALMGEVMVDGETSLSYTAPDGYYGNDSIQYTISDGEGGTDEATVTVEVYINHAPQADDDFVQATSNQSVEIRVLDNDSDVDGDSLTIVQAIASEGKVTIQPDGTLLYEPTQGFVGDVIIEYQVVDSEGDMTWASVYVAIEGNFKVKTEGGAGGSLGALWLAALMMVVWMRTPLFIMNRMFSSSVIAALVGLSLMPTQSSVASELSEQNLAGPWFITGGIYHALSDVTESDLDQSFIASGVDAHTLSLDKQRLSYGVGVGYFLTDNWFVEGGYLNTGDVDLTLQSSSTASQAFYDAIERIYPESGEGPYLQLGYRYRFTSDWSVTGKMGAFFWKGDYLSLPVDTNTGRGSDQPSDTDLVYGLSLDYQISHDWVTSLQAQRVEFDNYPTTMLGLNLAYHFGGEREVVSTGKSLDSDRDGVYDEDDACPNTPASHAVDATGCTRLSDVTQSIEALVLFANDSTRIEPEYKAVLEKLARAIDMHHPAKVFISGHASAPASSSYNLDLSQRRAQAVQAYLVTNFHLDTERLETEAFGERSLIKEGNMESDHASNRRVEIVFDYQEKQPILR